MFRILTTAALVAASVAGGATRPAVAADADGAARLSIKAAHNQPASAQIALIRKDGRFSASDKGTLRVRLELEAKVDATNTKIVVSELELKDAGTSEVVRGVGLKADAPAAAAALTDDFSFAVDPSGVIVQNAIAACGAAYPVAAAAGTARTAKTSVTVAWRVTTGRFNFPWVNYDRVAPDKDLQANPDFYGERETSTAELQAPVEIACIEGDGAKIAGQAPVKKIARGEAAKTETAKSDAANKTATATGRSKSDAVKPPTPAPKSSPAPSQTAQLVPAVASSDEATLPAPERPACSGGMIRETSVEAGSFICLCPGNTERVSTAANAYACEKRRR